MRRFLLSLCIICFFYADICLANCNYQIDKASDIARVFPKNAEEIDERLIYTKAQFTEQINHIIDIPGKDRTFENTLVALDRAIGDLLVYSAILEHLTLTAGDLALQNSAIEARQVLETFYTTQCLGNHDLFIMIDTFIAKQPKKNLSSDQIYFMDSLRRQFLNCGQALSQEDRDKLLALQEELFLLNMQFSANIQNNPPVVWVEKEELEGVDEGVITLLEQKGNRYKLTCDYAVYYPVIRNCSIASTRQRLAQAFSCRGFPENQVIMEKILSITHEMAMLLGYSSYAAYQLDNDMVENPQVVIDFLRNLVEKSMHKEHEEFILLTENLPESVVLSKTGKINRWDLAYLQNQYQKAHYAIDHQKIAEYFSLNSTIEGLIRIYETFFSIQIKNVTEESFNNQEMKVLEISDEKGVLGYIVLDLFPRTNKYMHACCCPIISPVMNSSGKVGKALSTVIVNFPKPSSATPSLLTLENVRTFFHEFGHALHHTMGTTAFALTGLNNVKIDFVELPSQMLEEWLWEPSMLKMISAHYQTKEPLSDDLIERIMESRNLFSGSFVLNQCYLSLVSLHLYYNEMNGDALSLANQLASLILVNYELDPENYFPYNFGHIVNYGSQYYAYLWSRVFALDIFATIRQKGLLNPAIGRRYVRDILGKAGGEDPNIMLERFLERKPSPQAFYERYGL